MACKLVRMARITVEPNPLLPGQPARICYRGKGAAGEIITVEVDDGREPPTTSFVPIELGPDGSGCVDWSVPKGWRTAAFNTPGAGEVLRFVRFESRGLPPVVEIGTVSAEVVLPEGVPAEEVPAEGVPAEGVPAVHSGEQ